MGWFSPMRLSASSGAGGPPPPRPKGFLHAALVGAILLLSGCAEKPVAPSPAVTEAAAALAREQAIRDAMIREREKLEGERQFHLFRSQIIAGEVKPPIMTPETRSPIVRSLPSWGVRRLWRLWGRRTREMPWFDEGSGLRMKSLVRATYAARDDELAKQIALQDQKIVEAKKYLDLVKSLEDDA